MSDMPKEIFARQIVEGSIVSRVWNNATTNNSATPYTLTAHHNAEIAKRDRAIEVLMAGLSTVRCEDANEEKMVFSVMNEAQAILNEHVNKSAKT